MADISKATANIIDWTGTDGADDEPAVNALRRAANTTFLHVDGTNPATGPQGFGTLTNLTVATGAITPTLSVHTVGTEAAAAQDDLDTITATNFVTGDLLILRAKNGSERVTLKDNTGNIQTPGAEDVEVGNAADDAVMLQYDGTNFRVIAIGHAAVGSNSPGLMSIADKDKVDFLTVTGATDLDAIKTKSDFLTLTGAVSLDVTAESFALTDSDTAASAGTAVSGLVGNGALLALYSVNAGTATVAVAATGDTDNVPMSYNPDPPTNLGTVLIYVDEDAGGASKLVMNNPLAITTYIATTDGRLLPVAHDASASSNGVQLYVDDNGATDAQFLFVSPTDTSAAQAVITNRTLFTGAG
jgi:hypothetical protein